jgi:hypothetical protein
VTAFVSGSVAAAAAELAVLETRGAAVGPEVQIDPSEVLADRHSDSVMPLTDV